MRELTQTNIDPGNCWQTCIACVLDLDPEVLPDQTKFDLIVTLPDGTKRREGPYYQSALQTYLRTHHGLAWMQLHDPPEVWTAITFRDPNAFHFSCGKTIRSATNGNLGHVVVSRNGETVWDPHPSRAGLTHDIMHAFLVPYPAWWKESDARSTPSKCVCPACKTAT